MCLISGEVAELSGECGSEPECQYRKQSETAGSAEDEDHEAEKHAPSRENTEEDHRGKTHCTVYLCRKKQGTS